jgi:Spy/CpxP family protein refolding chaperone
MLENDRVKAELGLTEDQTSRLRQIIVESQKSSVKTGADMAVRRIELRELLRAENPDRATVLKKVQEISDLRGQMMKQHVEALLAAKTVLSPEQQKKMRRLMQARRNGFWRGPEGRDRSVGPPNRPGFPSQGPGIPGEPPVE